MRSRCILPALFLLLLALVAAGCAVMGTGSKTGSLSVYLTDAPANDLKEVNVTITEVQVHRDGGWETVAQFPLGLEVNLLDLRFDEALLGTATLPAGAYTQIRLIVDDSSIDRANVIDQYDVVWPLKAPSGAQTGLKIHHRFIVPQGGAVALVLDVNVLEFVHKAGASGRYIINPTAIRVVDKVTAGSLAGRVLDAESQEPIDETDVTITLWLDQDQDGKPDREEAVAQTLALREDTTDPSGTLRLAGSFQLNAIPALESGSYLLEVGADGYVSWTRTGVTVVAGEMIEIDGDPSTPDTAEPILLSRMGPGEEPLALGD